jgi:dTDP-4-amino-4,6-dideoxygalactose transaminase
MKIDIFTPPVFEKHTLDIEHINNSTGKKWIYSSSGKASIYHILKDLNITKILIPVYICESVLLPLKQLNITPLFYDIEEEDLNPSLESIKELSQKYNVKTILVASMYGNPANLVEIEKFCKENDIFLIDDAAQSFGATVDNRAVGTFGDAGFFSFSVGKPTAGHLVSFFWSTKEVKIKRKKHCIVHYCKWLDFYFNRYKIYDNHFKLLKKVLNLFSRIQMKYIDITDDDICEFEKEILGGILHEPFLFRENYFKKFLKEFYANNYFQVIHTLRGNANNHKFILLFKSSQQAQKFIYFMKESNIYASNGYKLLSSNLEYLPNARKLDKRVVELPIENDKEKMQYLFKKVREFD